MNIEILQPKPFDLVGNRILIAGNAVGFEGHLSILIGEGHDEVSASASAGSTSIRQFQAAVDIPDGTAFTLNRLFVTVSDDSGGEDGIPAPTVTVPVLYGPLILPGYSGFWQHVVTTGDTLSKLALRYYDDAGAFLVIHQANQHIVANPSLIFPGQVLRIPRDF
ncbi:Gmad2 immunoglobulin-like domain-containing protein [Aurantimonas sp. A2-1-M11]|uniref:LysM peptidoglycan-binding domain-containing protein n=1 Tax=Aurantimonas sp. A2-1-M11 TaxID=3113712 RepID=UPI002F940968